MLVKTILPLSALVCLAAAAPLQQLQWHPKREVVWTTTVVEEIVTVMATTTIHLQPGQSPPSGPAGGEPHAEHHHEHHHRPTITSHIKSTVTVHRVPPNTAAPSNPTTVPSNPTTPAAAPSNPTTPAAAPSPVQQTTTPQAAPSPSQTTASPAPAPSSGGGTSTSSGQKYSGDITYYAPGLGSCGITNSATDMIVALAEDMMLPEDGANPNDNPLCGRSITISYGGKTAVATIEDTCPGCAGASLDMTPSLFEIFAPLATGRVSGVEWWFN